MLRGKSVNAHEKIKIQWVTMNLPCESVRRFEKKTTGRNLPRLLNILQRSLGFLPNLSRGPDSLGEFGFFQ